MCIISKRVAVIFGVVAIVLTLSKTVECGLYDSFGIELRGFNTTVATVEISCTFHLDIPCSIIDAFLGDIIADSYLISAPIYMVCHTKLAGQRRRMLVALSSFNVVTSFLSVARSVLSFVGQSRASFITRNAQVCSFLPCCPFLDKIVVQCVTSLSVCNLLVLVTFLYSQIRGSAKETAVSDGVTQHTPTCNDQDAIYRVIDGELQY